MAQKRLYWSKKFFWFKNISDQKILLEIIIIFDLEYILGQKITGSKKFVHSGTKQSKPL